MAAKLNRLTQKIAIQLHLVSESCTICSCRCRRPVRKLLDTPSYTPRMNPSEVRMASMFVIYCREMKGTRVDILQLYDISSFTKVISSKVIW